MKALAAVLKCWCWSYLNYFCIIYLLVIQAIFSAEKIQDLIPLGANGILILGQGNFFLSSV
jgi:hypothetical protein